MAIQKTRSNPNPGKTAPTHIKDASGLWDVHDGGERKDVVVDRDGKRLEGLSYSDARRGKDYAVTQLKLRKAGIRQNPAWLAAQEKEAPVARKPSPAEVRAQKAKIPDTAMQQQQLAQMRAPAVAAASGAAAQAQARHEEQKRKQVALALAKAKEVVPSLDDLPDGDDLEMGDGEDHEGASDDHEDLMGLGFSSDDAKHAKEEADKYAAEAELAGKLLLAEEQKITADAEIESRWAALTDKDRGDYRWRAMNEQPTPATTETKA